MESKQQVVDSILKTVRTELAQFIEIEGKIDSSVEYEERLLELGRQFIATTVSKSMGEMPKSRNSKKKY